MSILSICISILALQIDSSIPFFFPGGLEVKASASNAGDLHWIPSTTPQACTVDICCVLATQRGNTSHILGTPTIEQILEMEAEACFRYRSYRGAANLSSLPGQQEHGTWLGLDQSNFLPGLCVLGGSRAVTGYSQNRLVALPVRSYDGSFSSSQLQLESSVSILCFQRVTAAMKLKEVCSLE